MKAPSSTPSLIGGIGITRVTVYEQKPGPDSHFSGCPHLHVLTDEAYYVMSGSGRVEFFDTDHGLRILELSPGMYVHFPPLVMHRIISTGKLIVLGLMGNAGLAERGDARIFFGPEADEDESIYNELKALPMRRGLEGALRRRDASVVAYQNFLAVWRINKMKAKTIFQRFVDRHCLSVDSLRDSFTKSIENGPVFWGERTKQRLSTLAPQNTPDTFIAFEMQTEEPSFGMCGILHPIMNLQTLGIDGSGHGAKMP